MSDQIEPMKIWNSLCDTPDKHKRPYTKFGKVLTSVNATWQIMKLTELLGPVGHGWSFKAEYSIHSTKSMQIAISDVTLGILQVYLGTWGPIRGCSILVNQQGEFNSDAFKAATTDALTKAMAYLGSAADVYLEGFDTAEMPTSQNGGYFERCRIQARGLSTTDETDSFHKQIVEAVSIGKICEEEFEVLVNMIPKG